MVDSKDYFVARIVANEAIQCDGFMDFIRRNMKEQISNGILTVVSDGNEYVIKILPEQYIKKPDLLSVEVRQGISVKELVRCKDCKHSQEQGYLRYCEFDRHYGIELDSDWFCADGEKRDQ